MCIAHLHTTYVCIEGVPSSRRGSVTCRSVCDVTVAPGTGNGDRYTRTPYFTFASWVANYRLSTDLL